MTYYIFLDNGKLNGCGQCRQITEGVENLEVSEEVYNAYIETPGKYIYFDGEIVENPNYENEQALKERARLDMLSLTAADVERAIYKAKGIDFDDILQMVETLQLANEVKIDIKALKIEFKANNFYRGNPYINQIGSMLGYTADDLDYLFEYKELPKRIQEPIEEPEEDVIANPQD